MYDIFNSTICGRVSTEPKFSLTKDGKTMTNFQVAVTVGKDSNEKYITNFISVTAVGILADYAKDQLDKGERVTVIGSMRVTTNGDKTWINMFADSIFPGVYDKKEASPQTEASEAIEENQDEESLL